jgi:hypothetical protein
VLRWNADQAEISDRGFFPPVSFDNFASPTTPEEIAIPQRRIPDCSGVAGCKSGNGGSIQVIVVVVGENHRIDWRQSIELNTGWNPTPRTGEAERRGSLAPDRIEEDVETGHLDQEARVANPCERKRSGFGTWNDEIGIYSSKCARVRVRTARIPAPFDQGPFEKIKQPVQLRRGPWIPESASRPMMC